MSFEKYITNKKAFIFNLDNVLYPEKDYLLQVYYLFAEFMAYTQQLDAKLIINYMHSEFNTNGSTNLFKKTALKFNIDKKYEENFNRLHQNAKLPLKLLLYNQVLSFMQEIILANKAIYLLVDKNPTQQINKIKQIEWHGLEKYLKVYFIEEFEPKTAENILQLVINQHFLNKKDLLLIGEKTTTQPKKSNEKVDYLSICDLL